ncbi:TPA: hypothetical protein PIU59_003056 [Klebsiella quasipneumoniae subsp. similipneumoniae]|nr:hypothetical protein D0883_23125 [Klebsiella pneumoniae]VFZ76431.1 Uncharacterised protein [Klebsiella quasipneumoniae]HDH1557767.1 hypothetical protein [Klebsiella quasipneumoniae subsp. similipneumoniae]EKU3665035.1 hypothetical protein [Klebsiella pneumoniae]ELA0654224.1 hypothetical protein [Klebsiella pneumoniae]
MPKLRIYFSDFFNVTPEKIKDYGAFNISLINDLPLFIDPFLLFNNEKYKGLHQSIIKYVSFLRDRSQHGELNSGLIKSWFLFPEVKQNWLGYSIVGNGGSGLGIDFAKSLNNSFSNILQNFGREEITEGSHLEKLCLIKEGVGKDSVSDFTTNLIKSFLLKYTEDFAKDNIDEKYLSEHIVAKVDFNYETRSWSSKKFILPTYDGDYVLLTPRDILTKDETWINRNEMIEDFRDICDSISNDQLRGQLSDYFNRCLPDEAKKKERELAADLTIKNYPSFIDYYIRYKEQNPNGANRESDEKVSETERRYVEAVQLLVNMIFERNEDFFHSKDDTFEETYKRVSYLKQVIENNNGYKVFYLNGVPVKREADLQLMFRLTWFASISDVNSEVDNGRGPVDYKISRGSKDKTLVEFKLASNSKLKQNLANQVKVYESANETKKSIKVILYFNDTELSKLIKVFKELGVKESKELVIIDARPNKVSASNVK